MPAELFRPTVTAAAASRRASLLPLSAAVHAGVLVAVVLVPLLASGPELPAPHRAARLEYVKVELPSPPVAAPAVAASPVAARRPGISIEAPEGIRPETGLEGLPLPVADTVPVIGAAGIGGPDPGAIEGMAGARPVPSLAPRAPVRVGGDIEAPVKVRHVAPVYPEIAIRARVEGLVIIEAVIGTDGRVADARVLRSSPLLDRAALDAVRQWAFTPTTLNGQPVPVIMSVTVQFTLAR